MVELGLDVAPDLLALVCASHNGEPVHVEGSGACWPVGARRLGAAQHTVAAPVRAAAAACSAPVGARNGSCRTARGNAGMLATCVINGWATETYQQPDHPLQQTISGVIASLTGESIGHVGVDGCGAPAHAVSLTALARGFAAVAGTGRHTTRIRAGGHDGTSRPGRWHRSGCDRAHGECVRPRGEGRREGVLAAALPAGAVAVKLSDGSWRGFAAVVLAALDRLGADTRASAALGAVLGGGRPVGERPVLP